MLFDDCLTPLVRSHTQPCTSNTLAPFSHTTQYIRHTCSVHTYNFVPHTPPARFYRFLTGRFGAIRVKLNLLSVCRRFGIGLIDLTEVSRHLQHVYHIPEELCHVIRDEQGIPLCIILVASFNGLGSTSCVSQIFAVGRFIHNEIKKTVQIDSHLLMKLCIKTPSLLLFLLNV